MPTQPRQSILTNSAMQQFKPSVTSPLRVRAPIEPPVQAASPGPEGEVTPAVQSSSHSRPPRAVQAPQRLVFPKSYVRDRRTSLEVAMRRPASRKKEFLAAQQEELERLRVEVDRLSEALQHAVQSLATEEKRAGATSPILVGRLVRTVYTSDEDAESEWMGMIKKGDELIGIVRFESAVPGSNYYDETEDRIAI